jgi:hypothetical protein
MSKAAILEISKGCEGQCEFVIDELSTTLAGWQPRFDKFGNDVSPPNPNRVRSIYSCRECGGQWHVVEQGGKILNCRRDR